MKLIQLVSFFLFMTVCTAVSAQTVYITETGEKYHKEYCQYLRYSKDSISKKKAIELGYTACVNYSKTKTSTPVKTSYATQCTGTTQKGNRCKRRTKNSSGRCYQH